MLRFFTLFRFLLFYLLLTFKVSAQPDTVFYLNHETRNYDQKHIKLSVEFDFNERKVEGSCLFSFSPLINDFRELVLHAKTMTISSVKLADKDLHFSHNGELLFIDMDKYYSPDDSVAVSIDYVAYPSRGLYFFSPSEKIPEMPFQIWTQGQGTNNRYWYPAYDLPDDKLTSEIIITVPSDFIAISNGVLKNIIEGNGIKTFYWKMDHPYPNYLTSIIVGEFVTVKEDVRGTTLEYNIPSEWVEKKDLFYGRTPQMLNFFSDYICPYPYERYAQTTVQDFEWGGMENVTSTTLNRRILHDENAVPNYTADDLIAHEFAHQWFGDYLTCRTWEHIWLNEGFATYFTDLWYENEFGKDAFLYQRYLSNKVYFDDQLKTEPLDSVKIKSSGTVPAELNGSKAYEKGAAVLNMLRFELGDEKFREGIQCYVKSNRNRNVVTEDFRKAMEIVSDRDLGMFFRQWIYGAGFPGFKVDYSWSEQDNKLSLNVKQVQRFLPLVGLFKTPVPVEIIAGKRKIQEIIEITDTVNSFTFFLTQKPDLVRFNKNEWILCTVDFQKSLEELSFQLQYDDDVTGRIKAAKELSDFGGEAVPVLSRSLLRDTFYGVKLEIIETLKQIGGDSVLNPLSAVCYDPDARVREAAVRALSIFSYEKVEKVLFDILDKESNYYVKGAVLYSIGAVKHPDAAGILSEALKLDSHRNIIRRGIFEGFGKLGDPSVLPFVKEYTKYKYSNGDMHLLDITALDCAKSFADTHFEEVTDIIASALENPYFRTRIHAAKLLAELQAVEKLQYLENLAGNEHREVVKKEIMSAIKKLRESEK